MTMRKPIPKEIREQVYAKYNGHCAYCGCELDYKYMQNMDYGNIYEVSDLMKMADFFCDIAEHPMTLLNW